MAASGRAESGGQRHFAAVAEDALDDRGARGFFGGMTAAVIVMAVSLAFAGAIVATGLHGRPRGRRW